MQHTPGMPMRTERSQAAIRLAGLGVVAVACAGVAAAFTGSPQASPAAVAAPVTPRAVLRPPQQASPRLSACSLLRPAVHGHARRRVRQLAALVAPTATVHLASPLRQTPPLGREGYVFPVQGAPSVVDTFGAARAGVPWHHGDDIFALQGTPVIAVADGIVFSVGWQRLGGRRLWLLDQAGNEFYYAHLDAYSPLAANGEAVRAGDVLGYVGNSGDAEQTPPHLHFEIHPAALLGLGYDGAVNPTVYLRGWREGTPAAPRTRCTPAALGTAAP
ncbi:MAG: peptidoglycan LD-endopeptidase LytH [Gaiellaceae bacterium]|nr:peptidoglycan LD-endopeptidase LytH [Gaiellaceae bacterium]